MSFSPFSSQLANVTGNSLNHFTSSKFSTNLTQSNGQIVVSGGDGNFHYLRPTNGSDHSSQIAQHFANATLNSGSANNSNNSTNLSEPSLITLPITMPGAKPGDAQQTVHIQVMNPNAIQPQTKLQMGHMPLPLQNFQPNGTTVLTVAYNPTDGKFVSNGFPEGMTVVAALQPQDLQLLAQAQQVQLQQQHHHFLQEQQQHQQHLESQLENIGNDTMDEVKSESQNDQITVKQEPSDWDNSSVSQSLPEYSDYMQTPSFNLHSFLKFPSNVKIENDVTENANNQLQSLQEQQLSSESVTTTPVSGITSLPEEDENKDDEIESDTKQKRRRKAKKKTPKPKQPKPGQVLIATAIDGTPLFCCPECQMAYPEKENLEQHLTEHKIERRYICDICGAGLKRKEHLERHKSGHNPDRPYICSVCLKGFKRKEHLNLHFVIHSGEKNEVCGECGKGFYRKDHLRKHANSHAAKRLKEEMNARSAGMAVPSSIPTITPGEISTSIDITNSDSNINNNNNIIIPSNNQLIDMAPPSSTINSDILNNNNCIQTITNTQAAISLSTVYVPTSDNTTLPVQIQIPQIVTTCSSDGTTNTMIMPSTSIQNSIMESQNSALTT